jgi:hypothetical protein
MKINLIGAVLVGSALVLGGCDEKKDPAADASSKMKDSATKAADATKDAASKAVDATKDAAKKATDATKDAATKATDSVKAAIDTKVKEAADAYQAGLTKLNSSLSSIKTTDDASKAFPSLKDEISKVSGAAATLSAVPSDVKTKVMTEYKPQFDAAVKGFKEQVDRISKDAALAKSDLVTSLKNLKLFE